MHASHLCCCASPQGSFVLVPIFMHKLIWRFRGPFLSGFDCVSQTLCVMCLHIHTHVSPVNIMPVSYEDQAISILNFAYGAVAALAFIFHLRLVLFGLRIATSIVRRDLVLIAGLFAALSAVSSKRPPKTNAIGPFPGPR